MSYSDYLKSQHWRKRRLTKMKEVGPKCQHCASTAALQIHHLTYVRKGREKGRDLMVLCDRCHLAIEAWMFHTGNRPKGQLKGLLNFTKKRLRRMGITEPHSKLTPEAAQIVHSFLAR